MNHYINYWGGNLYFLPRPMLSRVFENEISAILSPERLVDGWKATSSTWLISEGKLYLTFLTGKFSDGEAFSLDEAYAGGSDGIFLEWFSGTLAGHSDMFDVVDESGKNWLCQTGVNFNFEKGILRNFSITHLETNGETERTREYTKRLAAERLTLSQIDALGSVKNEILDDIQAIKDHDYEWSNSRLREICSVYGKNGLLDILNIYYFEGFCFQPVCVPISFDEAFPSDKPDELKGDDDEDADDERDSWNAETHLSEALDSLDIETVEFWLDRGLTLHDYSGAPEGIAWRFFKKIDDIFDEHSEESCALSVDRLRAIQECLKLVLGRLSDLSWFEERGASPLSMLISNGPFPWAIEAALSKTDLDKVYSTYQMNHICYDLPKLPPNLFKKAVLGLEKSFNYQGWDNMVGRVVRHRDVRHAKNNLEFLYTLPHGSGKDKWGHSFLDWAEHYERGDLAAVVRRHGAVNSDLDIGLTVQRERCLDRIKSIRNFERTLDNLKKRQGHLEFIRSAFDDAVSEVEDIDPHDPDLLRAKLFAAFLDKVDYDRMKKSLEAQLQEMDQSSFVDYWKKSVSGIQHGMSPQSYVLLHYGCMLMDAKEKTRAAAVFDQISEEDIDCAFLKSDLPRMLLIKFIEACHYAECHDKVIESVDRWECGSREIPIEIYSLKGWSQIKQKDYVPAELLFRKLIEEGNDRGYMPLHRGLVRALARQELYEEADEAASWQLSESNQVLDLHLRSFVKYKLSDYDEAFRLNRMALKQDPEHQGVLDMKERLEELL